MNCDWSSAVRNDGSDCEILQSRDPEGRTVSGDDPNVLLLTAEDALVMEFWSFRLNRA